MSNKTLRILFAANGVFVFAGSLLGPLYAVYLESFEVDVLSISITWSVFLASSAVFTFFISRFGDGVKRKQLWLIAGFLIRAAAWFLFIFATSITDIIVIQILLGFGESVGSPAFDAIFAEHLDKGKHMRDYANWKLVANGMTAIGTVIGGLIVATFGFGVLFLLMSGLAIVSLFLVAVQPKRLF